MSAFFTVFFWRPSFDIFISGKETAKNITVAFPPVFFGVWNSWMLITLHILGLVRFTSHRSCQRVFGFLGNSFLSPPGHPTMVATENLSIKIVNGGNLIQ